MSSLEIVINFVLIELKWRLILNLIKKHIL